MAERDELDNPYSKQFTDEYDSVEPERVMSDKVFNKHFDMTPDRLATISDKTRFSFWKTLKWHTRQRMTEDVTQGMMIGDKTVDELDLS